MSVYDNVTEDWKYESFERNTPAQAFGPFESLVALWRSKWVEGALPAWRDFDFNDFDGWHGWLIVEDVVPGGNGDMQFRLWGTKVAELFQEDLTGTCMSEAEPGFFDPVEFEWITRVVGEGIILCTSGSIFWQDRQYKKVATVELPLADDGKNIDKVLCGIRDLSPEE